MKSNRKGSPWWNSRSKAHFVVILGFSRVVLQRLPVLTKRSLLICTFVAAMAAVLSGCGKNFYYAGRSLPPSKLTNRVLIGVQNPSALTTGALEFVDAYYDIRHSYDNKTASFSISGYSGKPASIQNLPEEQFGAVYNSNDGSFALIDYANEKVLSSVTASGSSASIAGLSTSIFVSRNQGYIFAANQQTHYLTVVDRSAGKSYFLNLPGVYKLAVNPGGTIALAFLQYDNTAYYVRRLQSGEAKPAGFFDCEPQNNPVFCVLPVADSSGTPLTFDRPVKALFSPDGSSAYVLNCGAECGGTKASIDILPTAPLIIQSGQQSGTISATHKDLPVASTYKFTGLTNGLFNGNTLYLAGQQRKDGSSLWKGFLTIFDTASLSFSSSPYSISDGTHGKMILADDNTLWIGSTDCIYGELGASSGCLTAFNTSTKNVFIDTYKGDLTGIAAVTGLHKIYVAEGGQVHIYNTTSYNELDNSFVTVTGTAYDVAYMDGTSDTNNTTY